MPSPLYLFPISGIFLKLHISSFPLIFCNHCKFGWDWSIMKTTLLKHRSTLPFVYHFPLEGFSWNLRPVTIQLELFKRNESRHNWSVMNGILLGEHSTVSLLSRVPQEGFSQISCSALYTHALYKMYVWLISVKNFTWRTKCLFVCISGSTGGILWNFTTRTKYATALNDGD